jgi:cell wall-associated NlpC family hydrolase
MELFICTNVYIPLRAAPSHRAEMVSQILFGERFSIIESSGTWVRIETLFDTYTGWIDSAQYGYTGWNEEFPGIISGRELICIREDGSQMTLAPGSELFNISDDLSIFTVAGTDYRLAEPHASRLAPHASPLTPHASLSETALQFLNTPYLWGGRTHLGIDCSGFVQIAFKIHGIALPRNASQQAHKGITVDFISDAKPGDVLFFSDDTDTISHTGILLAKETIIHAAGRVRLDRVDHQGIWSDEAGRYTHRLRLIKRMQ